MTITRSSLLLNLKTTGSDPDWQEFVKVYRPLIAHAARHQGIASHDLDDVVQAVLLKLVRMLPSFSYQREKGFFRSWLRQITRNAAADMHRQRQRESRSLKEIEPALSCSPAEADDFEKQLLQAAMTQSQKEFRERTWKCFVEHVLKRRSAASIALELGLSENAVYVNSSRVVTRLREFCVLHGEDLQRVEALSTV